MCAGTGREKGGKKEMRGGGLTRGVKSAASGRHVFFRGKWRREDTSFPDSKSDLGVWMEVSENLSASSVYLGGKERQGEGGTR